MCVCVLLLLAVLPALAGPRLVAGPSFDERQQRALVLRVGQRAELKCRVLRLADRAVSWVRSRDLQILSHAGAVFTADSRVSCSEAPYSTDQDFDNSSGEISSYGAEMTSRDDAFSTSGTVHTLTIERLRVSDSGRYECQINTEPKLSLFFNMTVVESSLPTVVVRAVGTSGGGVVWGVEGGAVRFACEVWYEPAGASLEPDVLGALPPLRVSWLHEGEPIDPRSSRGGVSLDTERWVGRVVSRLTLARVGRGDEGRYTCGEAGGGSADLLLRLRDPRSHEPGQSTPEWMQRDQAVARVSESRSAAQQWRSAGALWVALLLLYLT